MSILAANLLTGFDDDSPEEMARSLGNLALLGRQHAGITEALRLEVTRIVAGGATWTQVAAALGISRQEARERWIDWATYRRLRKEFIDAR